jgi:hypothetical protein
MEQHKVYLTAAQLRERYGGVSHMWIERRLKSDPAFPRPKKFGGSAQHQGAIRLLNPPGS